MQMYNIYDINQSLTDHVINNFHTHIQQLYIKLHYFTANKDIRWEM